MEGSGSPPANVCPPAKLPADFTTRSMSVPRPRDLGKESSGSHTAPVCNELWGLDSYGDPNSRNTRDKTSPSSLRQQTGQDVGRKHWKMEPVPESRLTRKALHACHRQMSSPSPCNTGAQNA